MRFKHQQRDSSLPEVNLVPMMDVLMSVLTFFILTSMTFTDHRLENVDLPSLSGELRPGTGASQQKAAESMVIGLNQQSEIVLDNQVITVAQLLEKMQLYLSQNPEGTVVLKADRKLPYKEVEKILKQMSKISNNRVSLAIENN